MKPVVGKSPGPRRILGNLLAEADLARLIANEPRRRRQRPPPATVLRTAAQRATALRVFARTGDRLWTPAPILDPPADGVIYESGPLAALPPTDELLAWCETAEAAGLRSCAPLLDPPPLRGRGRRHPSSPAPILWDAPLRELVWHLPVVSPAAVAAVNHRSFQLRVAEEVGCALPGARMVESAIDLDRLLGRPSAPASWVVKAPLSAAGRERFIHRQGPGLADAKDRRTVEHLFERHGPLLFEPWMDRIADYGYAGLLTADELRTVGIHRQQVDRKGQFAGIELGDDLAAADRDRFLEVAGATAAALRRAGYLGPFGIDAWTYRRADGTRAFHPLGEINARMTFGLVAWAGDGG